MASAAWMTAVKFKEEGMTQKLSWASNVVEKMSLLKLLCTGSYSPGTTDGQTSSGCLLALIAAQYTSGQPDAL